MDGFGLFNELSIIILFSLSMNLVIKAGSHIRLT